MAAQMVAIKRHSGAPVHLKDSEASHKVPTTDVIKAGILGRGQARYEA